MSNKRLIDGTELLNWSNNYRRIGMKLDADELKREIESGRFDIPNQGEAEILREALHWFAELMESKLRKNDHKGGWENENMYWLAGRLREEFAELVTAIDSTRDFYADPINIALEAADVANFAMMIADNARRSIPGITDGGKTE